MCGIKSTILGDWAAGIKDAFEVVFFNPPSVTKVARPLLEQKNARYELEIALAGGLDGLDAYRLAQDPRCVVAMPNEWLVQKWLEMATGSG